MKDFFKNLGMPKIIFIGVAVLALLVTIVQCTGVTPDNQPEAIQERIND